MVSPSLVWVCNVGDRPTCFWSHPPASVVTVVRIADIAANASTSQTSRLRAAGHTAQMTARTAVIGANTTMKWTSRMGAGSPLNVDKGDSWIIDGTSGLSQMLPRLWY